MFGDLEIWHDNFHTRIMNTKTDITISDTKEQYQFPFYFSYQCCYSIKDLNEVLFSLVMHTKLYLNDPFLLFIFQTLHTEPLEQMEE